MTKRLEELEDELEAEKAKVRGLSLPSGRDPAYAVVWEGRLLAPYVPVLYPLKCLFRVAQTGRCPPFPLPPPLPPSFPLPSSPGPGQSKSLEAEMGDLEAGADEEFQEIEERAEKAEEEAKQLHRKVEALEVRAWGLQHGAWTWGVGLCHRRRPTLHKREGTAWGSKELPLCLCLGSCPPSCCRWHTMGPPLPRWVAYGRAAVCVQASEKKKEGRIAALSAELKGALEDKAAVGKALEDAKRLLREAMQERTDLQEALGDKEALLEQVEGERAALEHEVRWAAPRKSGHSWEQQRVPASDRIGAGERKPGRSVESEDGVPRGCQGFVLYSHCHSLVGVRGLYARLCLPPCA